MYWFRNNILFINSLCKMWWRQKQKTDRVLSYMCMKIVFRKSYLENIIQTLVIISQYLYGKYITKKTNIQDSFLIFYKAEISYKGLRRGFVLHRVRVIFVIFCNTYYLWNAIVSVLIESLVNYVFALSSYHL